MPPRNALYAPAHVVNNKQNNPGVFNPSIAPDAAPSLFLAGNGLIDHRLQLGMYNGQNSATAVGALGWHGQGFIRDINVVPSQLGAAKIAAAAHVVLGTAMTLAGASTGITVVAAGGYLIFPTASYIPAGALCIDGSPDLLRLGTGFITAFYDPSKMLARAVSITGVLGGAGGNFIVNGYDVYGEAMSELITVAADANTVNGKKAFKFVKSVIPQFTDAQNYSVGTADVFGFPLFASSFFDQEISWNAAAITAATGFTAADTTAPTNATGDVRGTYAVQSASDGTKRLIINQRLSVSSLVSNGIAVGTFGQVQA